MKAESSLLKESETEYDNALLKSGAAGKFGIRKLLKSLKVSPEDLEYIRLQGERLIEHKPTTA